MIKMSKLYKKFSPNRILRKIGLKIVKDQEFVSKEFRRFSSNKNLNEIRYKILSQKLNSEFFNNLQIKLDVKELITLIEEFDYIFRKFKFKNLEGGFGYNNALYLFIFIRIFKPSRIIESGVFKGFTTYIIDNAAMKNSEIVCIEPNIDRIQYKSARAQYHDKDISQIKLEDNEDTLVFFDDHVPHIKRINFIKEKNFRYVIFDDDVNISNFFHDGEPPIPTLNMIKNYEYNLKNFEWTYDNKNRHINFEIDKESKSIFLDYYYYRFLELFEFTGYRTSSFTSILVRNNNKN
jgi:hypothetical protein